MTPATTLAGRRVALFGLGGSGLATALALQAGGADVAAWDDSLTSLDRARAEGVPTVDLTNADWSAFAALVLSPGVPLTHPAPHWTVERARAAGIEIIGDIELFCRERAKLAPDAPFVAITGTNGKSTTTALVAHILREAGRGVQMGGNIGTPILALDPPSPDRVHVIEMSSFQIDLTPSFGRARPDRSPAACAASREGDSRGSASGVGLAVLGGVTAAPPPPSGPSGLPPPPAGGGSGGPAIGVLLNITPDHLDRHGTMDNYAAIKERVVQAAAVAVVGVDDGPSQAVMDRAALAKNGLARAVSTERPVDEGVFLVGSALVSAARGTTSRVTDLAGIAALRGLHNGQNAAAAVAVCLSLDLDVAAIERGLRSFPGLHHRMEPLARRGQAIFVNDSKATNADSAAKALSSFDGPIHWILGGKAKEGGIEPLKPLFTKIAKAYLIGEATEEFAVTLDEAGVSYERCGALDRAVAAAAADAARSDAPEPVVLLSPACASYDQYRNFELRGDHFRALVRALPGVEIRT